VKRDVGWCLVNFALMGSGASQSAPVRVILGNAEDTSSDYRCRNLGNTSMNSKRGRSSKYRNKLESECQMRSEVKRDGYKVETQKPGETSTLPNFK
jgi:hypothetical protein